MSISERSRQRIAGTLFLCAFLAYGIGTSLVAPLIDAGNATAVLLGARGQLIVGCAMMLSNSVVVIAIGLLLRPALASANARTANTYVTARVFEGLALAVGAFALMSLAFPGDALSLSHVASAKRINFIGYQSGMLALGLGSLPFCLLLFQQRFVPRWLALWGLLGYAIFATGALLELFGLPYGIALSVPGGLFELVFGVWLIIRGVKL
ncbi:DUF4386 domain-containing protein [Turneriella parva]|uniref:DUF4386 domain-containing protein n=1 Tax=Turneriella parva (strain ATCC BAA-1111 / DSM 21527 / NCTC 11395 / H) TaxID=869212 RepID=I4B2Z8_TURPD|nr:DUF4386 domain-containing protein [Turneriella parva]AFM11655.1 hypothetical protein Turpa_1006 [Turneriella parva DSM 21527]